MIQKQINLVLLFGFILNILFSQNSEQISRAKKMIENSGMTDKQIKSLGKSFRPF